MYDFYHKKIADPNTPEEERQTYQKMLESMLDPEQVEKLRADIEEQRKKDLEAAGKQDDDCAGGGCKI